MQWYSLQNNQPRNDINNNHEELLPELQKKNIFYHPELTTEWLVSLQHPHGYFVNSEKRLLDQSRLNVSTLETTRYAVAALDSLDNLDAINKKAVTNYIIKRKLCCSFAVTEFNDGHSIDALTDRVDRTLSKHKLNRMRSRKIGVHAA